MVLINDEVVCKTDPTTPGMFNTEKEILTYKLNPDLKKGRED